MSHLNGAALSIDQQASHSIVVVVSGRSLGSPTCNLCVYTLLYVFARGFAIFLIVNERGDILASLSNLSTHAHTLTSNMHGLPMSTRRAPTHARSHTCRRVRTYSRSKFRFCALTRTQPLCAMNYATLRNIYLMLVHFDSHMWYLTPTFSFMPQVLYLLALWSTSNRIDKLDCL